MEISPKMIEDYYNFLIEEEKSKNTVKKYIRDVKAFADWAKEKCLCKAAVLEYKSHLLTNGYAPRSVNSVLSSLNSFFGFANVNNLRVKLIKIQQQIFTNESKELTKQDYERLLSTAQRKGKEKLYLLMQAICATGIRVSELSYLTVESLKQGKAVINMKGKMRIVIIPSKLCKCLMKFSRKMGIKSGSIFLNRKGQPIDRSTVWKMMKSLCEAAKVDKCKVFPHNLRHLFARTYYALQKDIVRLADILGHSSVNTTRIYTMEAVYCKGG